MRKVILLILISFIAASGFADTFFFGQGVYLNLNRGKNSLIYSNIYRFAKFSHSLKSLDLEGELFFGGALADPLPDIHMTLGIGKTFPLNQSFDFSTSVSGQCGVSDREYFPTSMNAVSVGIKLNLALTWYLYKQRIGVTFITGIQYKNYLFSSPNWDSLEIPVLCAVLLR